MTIIDKTLCVLCTEQKRVFIIIELLSCWLCVNQHSILISSS